MKFSEDTLALGLGAILIAGLFGFGAYIITSEDRKELKKAEIEKDYPPEYWTAKAAEAKASAEKHRIDVESKERLELDRRTRAEVERDKIREFEKDAPKEYWEHKKTVEEEKTKRANEHERIEADKYIARRNSEAIKDGVRSVGRALSNTHSQWSSLY